MQKTIQEQVAEKISGSGQKVQDTVVDKLADVEINKRIDLVTKAINKQDVLEKDLVKISKADIAAQYNEKAEVIREASFSKNKLDEIKKMNEKIAKLKGAINSALDSNLPDSYNKLTETLKKLDNVGNNPKEDSAEAE